MIEIWQPRWHDRKVLIAKYKVGQVNDIKFTKAKNLREKIYRLNRADIVRYPLTTNGRIECYEVPLDYILDKEIQGDYHG